jgi:glycosyltransferase involved in cell wall biosynthesis
VAPDTPPLVLVGPPGWGEEVDTRGSAVLVRQHVPRPVLQRLVTSAAAVVMPSLYEGFGLPVLEAMAAGTPVIASDIPAHREVGADTIRYFAPRSSDELAEQIGELARTGPSHPQLARARTRAASFTWARCARATAGAYQRSLA